MIRLKATFVVEDNGVELFNDSTEFGFPSTKYDDFDELGERMDSFAQDAGDILIGAAKRAIAKEREAKDEGGDQPGQGA